MGSRCEQVAEYHSAGERFVYTYAMLVVKVVVEAARPLISKQNISQILVIISLFISGKCKRVNNFILR